MTIVRDMLGKKTRAGGEIAMAASTKRVSGLSARLRLASSAAVLALAATALSGCDSSRIADDIHPRLSDPARRHPIVMVAETATLDVTAHGRDKGGEARAFVEATRFVRNYRNEGRGPLVIAAPRGGASAHRVHELRMIAFRNGVGPERIRQVAAHGPVVRMSYDRIAAVGPTCGAWGEDVTRNPHNLPYPNFGCATQRNLAAMAANPTDLMYPANETPRGSDTREGDRKNFNQNLGKGLQNAGSTASR